MPEQTLAERHHLFDEESSAGLGGDRHGGQPDEHGVLAHSGLHVLQELPEVHLIVIDALRPPPATRRPPPVMQSSGRQGRGWVAGVQRYWVTRVHGYGEGAGVLGTEYHTQSDELVHMGWCESGTRCVNMR